jgi:hypothetical protein
VGNLPKQTNYTTRLLQLKSKFDSTMLPLQLATKNGIGFDFKGITKGEMSVGFMLDLKKSNNIMSFHETISAIVLQLKKIH